MGDRARLRRLRAAREPSADWPAGMNLADKILWAIAHPDEFPMPTSIPGLPTEADELGVWAHRPDLGRAVVARMTALGAGPTGAVPEDAVIDGAAERAPLVERALQAEAERIASATDLTAEQALAVVETHGPDLHPSRAVRLHRRMTEETPPR